VEPDRTAAVQLAAVGCVLFYVLFLLARLM
jgi:hypothetical protein